MRKSTYSRIAFIGDYPPRKCGIATFTEDIRNAVSTEYPDTDCTVISVNDLQEGYDYPEEVRFEIEEHAIDSYRRAADFIHFTGIELVCLQHEFGIYGGAAGSHILALLREIDVPVVTTLHTVLSAPEPDQRRVLVEMERFTDRFIVMAERGKRILTSTYGFNSGKIDVIPHGIPDIPFVEPDSAKGQFGVGGKKVILTFGLLSPNKGIEYVIRALPQVVREVPNIVYIVLGATHPNLLKREGESYRLRLQRLAADLGVSEHVIFYNRYVKQHELEEFLHASDIYITPYLNPAQITSGTLAYAFGSGKVVLSTPYWHAAELLSDGGGIIVPFRDSEAIAHELISILLDDERLQTIRRRAYLLGRKMIWPQVAHRYIETFQKAREGIAERDRRYSMKTLAEEPHKLPAIRLDHLKNLSDSVGIFQHAKYGIPNPDEGYCIDDNARALILAVLLAKLGHGDRELKTLTARYASFLQHAFEPVRKRFRNFMGFDRRWLEETGSDDSQGRAIWALGTIVGRSEDQGLALWASGLFAQALPEVGELTAPRSAAFAIIGISEYLKRLAGDRSARLTLEELSEKLSASYRRYGDREWRWFEPYLSYANAKLSHALIAGGRSLKSNRLIETGLESLEWLMSVQTAEGGHFRPVGSEGFYRRNGEPARFDQQPVEAHATVSACIAAFFATNDRRWMETAWTVFEWFLGRNDLGIAVSDPASGGCFDALQTDRVNRNMGGESTLAYLLSLTEMHIAESTLLAYARAVESENPVEDSGRLNDRTSFSVRARTQRDIRRS